MNDKIQCLGCKEWVVYKHFNSKYCSADCKKVYYKQKYGYLNYQKQYALSNPDKVKISSQKYRDKNRPRLREDMRIRMSIFRKEHNDEYRLYRSQWRLKKRLEALEAYGNKCVCCGEMEIHFLTFDHINNDGYIDRKTDKRVAGHFTSDLLNKIKLGQKRKDIQILCYNCNCAKGFYGFCPHKKT